MAKKLSISDEKLKKEILYFHDGIAHDKRYASYDFCYLYFQTHRGHLSDNMEDSCMHLWSYLASWGMLRGSSALQQRSPAALIPLIKHFDAVDSIIWTMDVPDYPKHGVRLLKEYNEIATILTDILSDKKDITPSVTLVTKIMLGVYGNIPAFDRFFKETFHDLYGGFGVCGQKELNHIYEFYLRYESLLDNLAKEMYVIDFKGESTSVTYKKAKLIDMFGFTKSAPKK